MRVYALRTYTLALLWVVVGVAALRPLPGISYASLGFDSYLGAPSSLPVFNLSYSGGRLWTVPSTSQTYTIPDIVSVVADSSYTTDSRIFKSAADFGQYLGRTVGLDLGYGCVFSGNADVSSAQQQFQRSSVVLSYFRQELSLYAVALPLAPAIPLDPDFAASVDSLPTLYNESAYQSFISSYGTHAVVSVRLGGLATSTDFVSSEYYSQYGGNEVTASLNARLSWFGQAKAGAAYNFDSASSSFLSSGDAQWNALGGSPALASASQWAAWVDSIPSDPTPISFGLLPLASFISQPAKALNLARAVEAYLAQQNNSAPVSPSPPVALEWCECSELVATNPGSSELFVQFDSQPGHSESQPFQAWQACGVCGPSFSDAFGQLSVQPRDVPRPVHQTSVKPTLSLLAGLDSLGVGYDAVYGRLHYNSVLNFTFYDNKTFSNHPLGVKLSLIPDQTNVETTTSSGGLQQVIQNAQELASFYGTSVGFGADVPGAFALHWDVQSSSVSFERSLAAMIYTQEAEVLYTAAVFDSQLAANAAFLAAVELLPLDYDFATYDAFVQTYGTHVITQATYGGLATMRTWVSQQSFNESSEETLLQSASAVFDLWKAGAYVNSTDSEQLMWFNMATFSEATLQGGNVSAYDILHHELWSNSLPQAPVQVSIRLANITDFVPDAARSKNLQYHIASYLANQTISSATTRSAPVFYNGGWATSESDAQCDSAGFLTGVETLGGGSVDCGMPSFGSYEIQTECQTMANNEGCPPNTWVSSFTGCYDGFENNYARFPVICCSILAYYG